MADKFLKIIAQNKEDLRVVSTLYSEQKLNNQK